MKIISLKKLCSKPIVKNDNTNKKEANVHASTEITKTETSNMLYMPRNTKQNDSSKSLYRLSSSFVECFCTIQVKFVWYVFFCFAFYFWLKENKREKYV